MSRRMRSFTWKSFHRNLLRPGVRFTPLSPSWPSPLAPRVITCRLTSRKAPLWAVQDDCAQKPGLRVDFSCLLINHVISCGAKVDLLPLAQGLKFTTRVRLIFSCAIERARLFFFHDDALVNSSPSKFIYCQQ